MDKLSKIDISVLKDIYGAMLTDRQSEVLQMYCDCDCSLGEIELSEVLVTWTKILFHNEVHLSRFSFPSWWLKL